MLYFTKVLAGSTNVYITGAIDTVVNGENAYIATMWKNGTEIRLAPVGSNTYGVYVH